MKVNSLNNNNKKLTNHQDTLKSKIVGQQGTVKDKNIRLKTVEERLLDLTAFKHKAELEIPLIEQECGRYKERYEEI